MPDEARDGRNVALNLTSVHGVLDCPKKNQAIAGINLVERKDRAQQSREMGEL